MTIHPATAHLPIGLLFSATAALLLELAWTEGPLGEAASVMLVGGLAGGGLSAATGLYELWRLRDCDLEGNVSELVDRHLQLMFTALTIFGAATYFHFIDQPTAALAACGVGAGLMTLGGHVGGTLVHVHHVGSVADDSGRQAALDSVTDEAD